VLTTCSASHALNERAKYSTVQGCESAWALLLADIELVCTSHSLTLTRSGKQGAAGGLQHMRAAQHLGAYYKAITMDAAPSFFTVMATGQVESAEVGSARRCEADAYKTSLTQDTFPHRYRTVKMHTASSRLPLARTGSCSMAWRTASRKRQGSQ
jgi:hypothetical protein